MRRILLAIMAVLGFAGAAHADDRQSFDLIERGRKLAIAADCVACHSVPGETPFAGGVVFDTPFGRLISPNITPDLDNGIGKLTDDEFVAALLLGRSHKGKRLYPAMPYPAYTLMSREDALAIRAYLATVEPSSHRVVANQLPFPLNQRIVMAGWNWLNFTPGRMEPQADKSPEWNRGRYLVDALGHCGYCHTPKTWMFADKRGAYLQGATYAGWLAPDITAEPRKGIGGWSEDELVQYLKTGANRWTMASGPMAEVVHNSTSLLDEAELRAIAIYLQDRHAPSHETPPPLPADDARMVAGLAIYKDNCAACHTDAGTGAPHLFPRLAGSAVVQSDDPTTLIHLVLTGGRAGGTAAAPTAPAMPAFGWRLNDADVATLLTYVRNAWGNAAPPVKADQVKALRPTFAAAP